MTILAKFQLNHHSVVSNILHNLHRRETTYLFIFLKLSKTKFTFAKVISKNSYGNIRNIMDVNTPAEISVPGGGDDNRCTTPSGSLPKIHAGSPQPSTSQCGKESNNELNKQVQNAIVVEHNSVYRHARFTRSKSGQAYFNRSLPDQASLQNVYLRREDNKMVTIQRHYSTGDVRKKREETDSLITSFRKWIPTTRSQRLPNRTHGVEFKLMNYNVLAQDLLTEHAYLYQNHAPTTLLWETRWKNLLREIKEHNADIICLQEVQESHIEKYYSKISELGYGSIFKKRTGYRTDGCALYYRQDMFTLIDYITVEYYQPRTTILDRENVAIIAIFTPVDDPDTRFCVATTHLLYNPRRQDIRVAQTQVLLAEIERMAYKGLNETGQPEYYPIIVTGDFNSEPDSAVVELITKGKLEYELLQNRTLSKINTGRSNLTQITGINGKELIPPYLRITDHCQHLDLVNHRMSGNKLSREEQETFIHLTNSNHASEKKKGSSQNETLFSTGQLSHNFKLKSAFKHKIGNDTEGTTFQNAWITVDYIFYSTNPNNGNSESKLKLLARYSIPTTKQLNIIKTIPNFVLGSDHLALLTKFKLEF